MQHAAAGAAQVGAAAGAQQVGAAGAQQVGAGAQQLGLQHLVWQHFGLQHLVRQQCNLGILKQHDFLQQLPQLLPQQEAAGAAHVGAQTGAGAQQVGAGAQQLGAGAQQLFWQQLLERQQPPKLNAFASVALAQQNSKAAINVVNFIIVISWNGVSDFWD